MRQFLIFFFFPLSEKTCLLEFLWFSSLNPPEPQGPDLNSLPLGSSLLPHPTCSCSLLHDSSSPKHCPSGERQNWREEKARHSSAGLNNKHTASIGRLLTGSEVTFAALTYLWVFHRLSYTNWYIALSIRLSGYPCLYRQGALLLCGI